MRLTELRFFVRRIIEEIRLNQRLRVFDFDDTLVISHSKTKVTSRDGEVQYLTPAEYAVYEKHPGDVFDFGEFDCIIDPHVITWTERILRRVYTKYGPSGAVILTARGQKARGAIEEFLSSIGYHNIEVVTLGDSDPMAKAEWIARAIEDQGLQLVEFFDDSHKNVAAVKSLQERYPNVKVIVRRIDHS